MEGSGASNSMGIPVIRGKLTDLFPVDGEPEERASGPSILLSDPALKRLWDDWGFCEPATAGVRVTPRRAMGHAPLWRGINLIVNAVAGLPLVVFRYTENGGREKATTHPAFRLLRRKVNPFLKTYDFKKVLTAHALIYGNGYAVVGRDGLGRPVELLVLDPTSTCPIQKDGAVWYVTHIGGRRVKLPAADVFHIKGLSNDGLEGYSVIHLLANALGGGIAARDFAIKFFSQGTTAKGVLMYPPGLAEEAKGNTVRDFNKMTSGMTAAHRTGILRDGVKWQQITVNPEQSQMLQTQDFDLRVCANVLNLPPHKVGDTSTGTHASMEERNQEFLSETIDAWLLCWEEECWDKLLSDEEKDADSHFMEFNRAALLRADLLTRYQAYAIGKQWGWLNTNRILAKENEEPIGSAGDVFWAPANMLPIEQLGQDPGKAAQAKAPDDEPIRAASVAAVMERLRHLGEIENEQVQRAAKREPNFVGWLEGYYGDRAELITDAVRPVVHVLSAMDGRSNRFTLSRSRKLAEKLVTRSKDQLLQIAGSATAAQLTEAVGSFRAVPDATELRALVCEILGVV